MRKARFSSEYEAALKNPPLCGCGCGQTIQPKHHWRCYGVPICIQGHNNQKGMIRAEYDRALLNPPICKCGCGEIIVIKKYMRLSGVTKYLKGHSTKGVTSPLKNKTFEEIFGDVRAAELKKQNTARQKGRISSLKGKTYDEIHGKDQAAERKKKLAKSNAGQIPFIKGKTYEDYYGASKAEELKAKRRQARLLQVFPSKDTKLELFLQQALLKENIKIETHKPICGQPDIFIEPNICIFADGDYWHATPRKYASNKVLFNNKTAKEIREKDNKVTNTLISDGYIVLRFWEHDVYTNIDMCILKIKGVLK